MGFNGLGGSIPPKPFFVNFSFCGLLACIIVFFNLEFEDMESENVMPQGFEPQKTQKSFPLFFTILFFVLVVGLIFYILKSTNTSINPNQPSQNGVIPPPPIPLDEKSPEEQLNILKSRGVILVPEVKSKVSIEASKFPPDLLGFFGKDLKDLKTQSVNFSTGQTGFVADFNVSKDSQDVIKSVIAGASSSSSWKILYAVYSEEAALADLESKNYQVSIEVTLLADRVSSVHINLIKK